MSLINFLASHRQEFVHLLAQHILLVGVSTLVAIAIGMPVGILAARRPRVGAPVVWLANVVQTIPSLAMFGFLLPLPFVGGLGARVAIFVLDAVCAASDHPHDRVWHWQRRSRRRRGSDGAGHDAAADSVAGAVAAGVALDRGGRSSGIGDRRRARPRLPPLSAPAASANTSFAGSRWWSRR